MRRMVTGLLFAGSVFSGCGQPPPTVEDGPIRIGVLVISDSHDDEQIFDGAQLAADEINASGGVVNGRQVEIVYGTATNNIPADRDELIRLIDEEGVVAVVGPNPGISAAGIGDIAHDRQVPLMTIYGGWMGAWSRVNPSEDRYAFSSRESVAGLIDYAADALPADPLNCHRFLYVTDAMGGGETEEFNALTRALGQDGFAGFEVLGSPGDLRLLTQTLGAYSDDPPDCLGTAINGVVTDVVLARWLDTGMPIPTVILFGDQVENRRSAGEEPPAELAAFDRVFEVATPAANNDFGQFDDYRSAFRASFGELTVDYTPGDAYDMTAYLLMAMERAGGTEGSLIRDSLYALFGEGSLSSSESMGVLPGQLASGLDAVRRGRAVLYDGVSGGVEFRHDGYLVGRPIMLSQTADYTSLDLQSVRQLGVFGQ